MKKILLHLTFSLTLTFSMLQAQETRFVVNEVQGIMSQGNNTGLEVHIPEVAVKDVESALAKWGKSTKAKVITDKKSPEIFIDNAVLPSVSDNSVDIYATVSPAKEGVLVRTYVDLGGIFLSSAEHPKAFAAMELLLANFAKDQLISLADQHIKDEEKHLANLESELKSLQRDKSNYEKDIRNHTDNIYKREQEIVRNEQDQKVKEQQIAIQQDIVMTARQKATAMGANDPATKKMLDGQIKTEEKNLKSFENQLKSLRNSLSAAVKDIDKSKTTISQREMDLIKNAEDQTTKEQQIELQKKILEMVRQKRADIR
jgi:hypothetical protein